MATADELSQITDLDDRVAAMMAAMEEATAQVSKVFEPTTDEHVADAPTAGESETPHDAREPEQSEPEAVLEAEVEQADGADEPLAEAPDAATDAPVESREPTTEPPAADEDVIPGNIRTLDEELAQVAEHFIEGSFDEGEAEAQEPPDPAPPVAANQSSGDTPDDQPDETVSDEPPATAPAANERPHDEPPVVREAHEERSVRRLPRLLRVVRLQVHAAIFAMDRLVEGRPPIIRRAVGWIAVTTTVYAVMVWAVVALRAFGHSDRTGQQVVTVEPD